MQAHESEVIRKKETETAKKLNREQARSVLQIARMFPIRDAIKRAWIDSQKQREKQKKLDLKRKSERSFEKATHLHRLLSAKAVQDS